MEGKSNLFLRFTWHSLGFKLTIALALLVSMPLFFMGKRVLEISDTSIARTIEQDYVQIAQYAAERVAIFVYKPKEMLESLASMLGAVPVDRWQQESLLVEMALNHDFFRRISLFSLEGEELVCSDLGSLGNWKPSDKQLDMAKKNKIYLSSVKFADNKVPYVEIIIFLNADLEGARFVAANVNIRGMWDIVDNVRLGETGRAYMVDNNGHILAHKNKQFVLQHKDISKQKFVRAVLASDSGYEKYSSEDGTLRVVTYAPLKGLDWGLIIEQDADETYAMSEKMKRQSQAAIWLSLIVAVLVSVVIGHFLALPIRRLLRHFDMLSKGVFQPIKNIRTKDELGNLLRAFNATGADVEDRRKREQKDMVGDAAAWIAHELKNSLNTLKTFIQLFPRKKDDEEFVGKFTKLMPEELERVERLLRGFSDNGGDGDALSIAHLDLVSLVGDTALLLENSFNEKHVSYVQDFQKETLPLYADLDRLRQVFINLFSNALKAMQGEGTIKVCMKQFFIGDVEDAPWAEIRISDTGCGIDEDKLAYVFKPFVTTGDHRKDGSMGLGLPICRRIIEQHGGSIRVESVKGVGTTFIIFLPLFVFKEEKKLQNA